MRRCARLFGAALMAMLALTGMARAQGTAPSGAAPELYKDALQSIAEGRKNDAYQALTRVIEKEPLHAGAWLDLALIQCGLGHADEAERLFAAIETRFNPPQGILELIAAAREQGCSWHPHSSASLVLGRGIDQNVNQGASDPRFVVDGDGHHVDLLPEFLPQHDQYTALSAEFLRDVTPNGSIGFVQYQARHNDRLHQFDSASVFAGVETPWRFGRWTARGTGMLGAVTLGGALYERQEQLQLRVGPPLPLPGSTQFTLLGGLTHTDYLTLSNFNSNTYELRGQFTYRNEERYANASVGYLFDHAEAARPGGSRHGWLANLSARQRFDERWTGELGYTRQSWDSASAYSPGLIDEVRSQLTQVLRATLSYPVGKNQTVQVELRQVRNRENISIFQYNNRQLQLSWQWQR